MVKLAGYSQDSKLNAEFDITEYVQSGENTVASWNTRPFGEYLAYLQPPRYVAYEKMAVDHPRLWAAA